jgi:ferredoxin
MSGPKLRVIADRSACCGYGVCAELCPEIFKVDDIGIVSVLTDIVPEGMEAKAREGASACPTNALRVVEESGTS